MEWSEGTPQFVEVLRSYPEWDGCVDPLPLLFFPFAVHHALLFDPFLQVVCIGAYLARVVSKPAEKAVAARAQESTNHTGRVVVIDEWRDQLLLTHRAGAGLLLPHRLVVLGHEPIRGPQAGSPAL